MRQATIIPMAIALASALAIANSLPASGHPLGGSRFLAGHGQGNGPKNKKCSIDPSVCYGQGGQESTCCGDSCVNVQTDPLNCGKCGKTCKFTDSCCEGQCVDLNYDKKNCGSCSNKCEVGAKCVYGMCSYA